MDNGHWAMDIGHWHSVILTAPPLFDFSARTVIGGVGTAARLKRALSRGYTVAAAGHIDLAQRLRHIAPGERTTYYEYVVYHLN